MTMVKQKFYNHIQNYTPKFTPSYKTQGSHTYCAVCMGPLCLIYTLSQNSLNPTHTEQYVCDLVFCKRILFIWGVVVASGQTVKLYFTPTLHSLSLWIFPLSSTFVSAWGQQLFVQSSLSSSYSLLVCSCLRFKPGRLPTVSSLLSFFSHLLSSSTSFFYYCFPNFPPSYSSFCRGFECFCFF